MRPEVLGIAGGRVWHANRDERTEAWSVRNDNFVPGDEGFAESDTLDWYRVERYPVSRLQLVPDAAWLQEENAQLEGRYHDMLNGQITSPVILMDDGRAGWIWDGYHRAAAALAASAASVPAIVGVRKPEFTPVLFHGAAVMRTEFRKGFGDDRGENLFPQGFFFTPDREIATTYGEAITAARLSMERPYVARTHHDFVRLEVDDAEAMLIAEGYDSAILYQHEDRPPEYVVFRPEQVHIVEFTQEDEVVCSMRP